MSHKELWPIWYLRRLFCDACMRRLAYDAFVVRILLAFIGSSVFRLTFLLIDMDAVLVASVSMGKITMRVGDFYFPISIVGMAISLSSLQISVSILNTPFPFHLLKKTSHFLSKCSLVSMCTLCGGTLSLHCYGDVICVQGGAFFFHGMMACKHHAGHVYPGLETLFSLSFPLHSLLTSISFMIDDGQFIFGGGRHKRSWFMEDGDVSCGERRQRR